MSNTSCARTAGRSSPSPPLSSIRPCSPPPQMPWPKSAHTNFFTHSVRLVPRTHFLCDLLFRCRWAAASRPLHGAWTPLGAAAMVPTCLLSEPQRLQEGESLTPKRRCFDAVHGWTLHVQRASLEALTRGYSLEVFSKPFRSHGVVQEQSYHYENPRHPSFRLDRWNYQ